MTITGGRVTGSGFYRPLACGASSCANFDGPDVVGKITVRIAWTTTGPAIAPTVVVYKNNPATASGAPTDTITLQAPPGSATKAGSFVVPSTSNTTEIKTDVPAPPCGGSPFSSFKISGGRVLV